MIRHIVLLIALALGALLALIALPALPALAQANCAPREIVVDRLSGKYGETRQSMGLAANSAVVEVFASDASGSWTIIVTSANGLTCLIASGQAYEALSEALPKEGDDT